MNGQTEESHVAFLGGTYDYTLGPILDYLDARNIFSGFVLVLFLGFDFYLFAFRHKLKAKFMTRPVPGLRFEIL